MKRFNTTGTCRPNQHYMVDITERLGIIREMIAHGDYFCINRGRQYGKTTTLAALAENLKNDYCVFNISFEGLGDSSFSEVENSCAEFLKILKRHSRVNGSSEDMQTLLKEVVPLGCKEIASTDFAEIIAELCTLSDKPIVVLIDEVDQASNNDGFIKFLGLLRNMYLSRETFPTFQSVILAGVYDIKNLKLKIRPDDQHQYNSPWNIAVPFNVDMSLSAKGIADMLAEYKADHHLTFDEVFVGQMIRDYTAGYPFLVSRICQIMDTEQYTWDKEGVLKAVNMILNNHEHFFEEIKQIINDDPDLYELLQDVVNGRYICYMPYAKGMQSALTHGFIKRMVTPVEISTKMHTDYLVSFCFRSATEGGAC